MTNRVLQAISQKDQNDQDYNRFKRNMSANKMKITPFNIGGNAS